MIEVEAKVFLNQEKIKYKNILKFLEKNYQKISETQKKDYYFKNILKQKIRVRETEEKIIVTHKNKTLKNKIEVNQESEFEIKDKSAFFKFLKKLNFILFAQKNKKTYAFKHNNFTIELNYVKNLGWFLEIEKLCSHKKNLNQEFVLLEKEFEVFGFSKKDFEPKKYLELLKEKNLFRNIASF